MRHVQFWFDLSLKQCFKMPDKATSLSTASSSSMLMCPHLLKQTALFHRDLIFVCRAQRKRDSESPAGILCSLDNKLTTAVHSQKDAGTNRHTYTCATVCCRLCIAMLPAQAGGPVPYQTGQQVPCGRHTQLLSLVCGPLTRLCCTCRISIRPNNPLSATSWVCMVSARQQCRVVLGTLPTTRGVTRIGPAEQQSRVMPSAIPTTRGTTC